MNPLQKARIEGQARFQLVWLIPLLCLFLSGFYAYRHYRELGRPITIRFDEADGIMPDKTKIKYLGVVVGGVTGVAIDAEKGQVAISARLDRSVEALARKGTVFVIVRPEVGFRGVAGLTTIFSGSSIDLRPGKGEPAAEFKGYGDMKNLIREEPGLTVNLTASRVSSLQAGDQVSYRGVKVGAVTEAGLARTGQSVFIRVKIEPQYEKLVRTNSKFWEASGVHAKLGLLGGNISVDSLQAFLKGGIAFATPGDPGGQARPGAAYVLSPKAEADWER